MAEGLKKVLIVEDHATIRLLFRRILQRRKDVDVQATSTGELAEKIVASDKFDLIIMDYHLPRRDGLETVTQIRTLDTGKSVPIVMCSAFDVQANALEAGCNGFLRKPVTIEMVETTVAKFLGPPPAA
ncbi:MAG: response regulator [Bdellovibrionota bacterium]